MRDISIIRKAGYCVLSAVETVSQHAKLWLRRSCPRRRQHHLPEARVTGGVDDVLDCGHCVRVVIDLMTCGHFSERPVWPLHRQLLHDRFVDAIGTPTDLVRAIAL